MIEVKVPKHLKKIETYINNLPKFIEEIYYAYTESDANNFIKKFKSNLKNNKLGVAPLSPVTVERKREKGYSKPSTPLYGKGESDKNSYYYMFLLKRIANGHRVYPRWAKHHEGDIQLRELLHIHEYGATIIVSEKMRGYLHSIGIHLKSDTWLIRIPPRPIAFLTYRQMLKERKNKVRSEELKRAITEVINTGNKKVLEKIKEREVLLNKKNQTTEI